MAFTIEDVNEEIRFQLGDLSQEVISDFNLNKIIQKVVDKYSLEDEDFCIVTYYSLLNTLQWLLNKSAASSAGMGGSEVKSRKEKVGDVEVQVTYSDGTAGESGGWDTLYDKYRSDPTLICESLADLATSDLGYAIFGGVSQKEYDRVNRDPDSRNGYDVQTEYKKSPYSCFRRRDKRFW